MWDTPLLQRPNNYYHPTARFASAQNWVSSFLGDAQTAGKTNSVGVNVVRNTSPERVNSISKRCACTGSAESGGSVSETPNTKPETVSAPPVPQPTSVTNDISAGRATSMSF